MYACVNMLVLMWNNGTGCCVKLAKHANGTKTQTQRHPRTATVNLERHSHRGSNTIIPVRGKSRGIQYTWRHLSPGTS